VIFLNDLLLFCSIELAQADVKGDKMLTHEDAKKCMERWLKLGF
jgi:hypothetical protein